MSTSDTYIYRMNRLSWVEQEVIQPELSLSDIEEEEYK